MTIYLSKGQHAEPDDGMCVMEAASFVAGEPFSDHPPCVSPVLGAFARTLNDAMPDVERQMLEPFIERLVGTAGDGKDAVRMFMCADWACRVIAPLGLDAADLPTEAEKLRALAPITDRGTAHAAYAAAYGAAYAACVANDDAARVGRRLPGVDVDCAANDDAARVTSRAARAAHAAADAAPYGAAYGAADAAARVTTPASVWALAVEFFSRLIDGGATS